MRRRSAPAAAGPCCRGSRRTRRPTWRCRAICGATQDRRTSSATGPGPPGPARDGPRGSGGPPCGEKYALDGYSAMNHATRGELMPETQIETVETFTTPTAAEDGLVEESLVEEVSIDGMCGVY